MRGRPRRWEQLTAVALGGALGTLGRAALTDSPAGPGAADPWSALLALMAANVLGTLALAALTSALLASTGRWSRLAALAAGTGACGALTTYSGLVLDAVRLSPGGLSQPSLAPLLVLLACAVAGVLAAAGGWLLGSLLRPPPGTRSGETGGPE
ncbi:CrcB family protein [Brevibacterium album]|uniref:CrcB family protein n=1 Tax=Brevibacterium album TaxID=417948 RepID=UPI0004250B4A|nr:CrcB family protein [Brevibacterium album]